MSLQSYLNYWSALDYDPSDVVCLAFINANNSNDVQHSFMKAGEVATPKMFDALTKLNENYNVYAALNPFKPELLGQTKGRTKKNVAKVVRLYADVDKGGMETVNKILSAMPEPTLVMQSSPDKFQLVWTVDDLTQETAEPLMSALAAEYGTDPAATDTPRVLRVPGFRNLKYIDVPEVNLVKAEKQRYHRSQFPVQYAPKDVKVDTPKSERPLIAHGHIHQWLVTRAGVLREKGLTPEEIEPILLRMAHAECELPLDDKKIIQVARSMANYEQGQDKSLLLTIGQENVAPVITMELLNREFPAYDGTQPAELPMLVQGFMPKGVGFLGSLSGVGKTWVALSITKALTSGMPLWGVFPVKKKCAVLYLVPEASDSSFKRRLAAMKITQDASLFRFRTITQGITRPLSDPITVAMVQHLHASGQDVLVIVDTAVRFFNGGDENAAKENNLVRDSDMLRSIGADVLFLHHSPKATKDAADLTLENTLRGSGDFGAMSDYVYGFRRDEGLYAQGEGPEEVEVVCVKPRDFEPPLPFRLQFRRKPHMGETPTNGSTVSVIDETNDLRYIGNVDVKDSQAVILGDVFKENPNITQSELAGLLHIQTAAVKQFARRHGWKQVEDTKSKDKRKRRWIRTTDLLMGGMAEVSDTPSEGRASNTVSFNMVVVDGDPAGVGF